MSTYIGGDKKKVSLIKYGDYNSGTETLSKNPNPKYTLTSLSLKITKRNPSLIIYYVAH